MNDPATSRASVAVDPGEAREVGFGVPMSIQDSFLRGRCRVASVALTIALASCASARAPIAQIEPIEPTRAPAAAPSVVPEPTIEVFAEWDRVRRAPFEAAARAWLPDGRRARLGAQTLTDLSRALADGGERAVRAAILLAQSHDPAAQEALLASLERRVDREAAADPTGDACDVVAAVALRSPDPAVRECAARLEALGSGAKPHPDLDVRVECAVAALTLGRTRTIPFLVRILREGTATQAARVDWKRGGDVTFAQACAAAALAERAGVDGQFRPDGSVAARSAEADRLERILVPPRPKKR